MQQSLGGIVMVSIQHIFKTNFSFSLIYIDLYGLALLSGFQYLQYINTSWGESLEEIWLRQV